MFARLLLPLSALLAIAAAGAGLAQHAENSVQAATRWGLPGTWKRDCLQPVSRSNPAFTFVVREGQLYQLRDLGDVQDTNLVSEASILPEGDLETTTIYAGSMVRTVVQRKIGQGRFVVWSNRIANTNNYSIKDGGMPNGTPAPVLTRCR